MKLTCALLVLSIILPGCLATPPAAPQKLIVEFPVHAETRTEFITALNEILVDTRAFDGCRAVTVWTNESDDDNVWLYEEWETREHQAAYLNWRVETGNTAHLGPFIRDALQFLWLEEH
jgi:quinol monooxygenase YgiN